MLDHCRTLPQGTPATRSLPQIGTDLVSTLVRIAHRMAVLVERPWRSLERSARRDSALEQLAEGTLAHVVPYHGPIDFTGVTLNGPASRPRRTWRLFVGSDSSVV